MKTLSTNSLNEKIHSLSLLIKNLKKTYNDLNIYLKKKKELEFYQEIDNTFSDKYKLELEKINKKILELESELYIYLGKIKQELSLIREDINKNKNIDETFKTKLIENVKNIIIPITQYNLEDHKFKLELSKIEEELKKIETIPDIHKIEDFDSKKLKKKEEKYLENLYKIKKKLKKKEEKIDLYNIFVELSDMLFGKLSNYILDKYPKLHYELRKKLFVGKISISPSKFLSVIFMLFFILSIISVIVFFILFEFTILILFSLIILSIPLLFYVYITYRISQIRKNIDMHLPFAAIHILSILQTGIDIENCFRLVAEMKDYGYLSVEFKRLADLLNAGLSLSDAIEHVRDTTVSERFKEFLDELLLTLRSGRNIKEFFVIYTESQLMLYRTDLEKLNQFIKNFSDLYVGLVLTVPMLIISVGIMLSTITPTIFGLTISEFLNLVALVVLPIINIGILVFISRLEK